MSLVLRKFTVTEKHLKRLSLQHPQLFKIVRTDVFSETAMFNNKLGFKTSDNPNMKRLSCVKIFNY